MSTYIAVLSDFGEEETFQAMREAIEEIESVAMDDVEAIFMDEQSDMVTCQESDCDVLREAFYKIFTRYEDTLRIVRSEAWEMLRMSNENDSRAQEGFGDDVDNGAYLMYRATKRQLNEVIDDLRMAYWPFILHVADPIDKPYCESMYIEACGYVRKLAEASDAYISDTYLLALDRVEMLEHARIQDAHIQYIEDDDDVHEDLLAGDEYEAIDGDIEDVFGPDAYMSDPNDY